MASYRILYWGDIPAQVRAEDALDQISIALPARFIALIDREAIRQGVFGEDAYLERWVWSEPVERPGSAAEVSAQVASELEARFP